MSASTWPDAPLPSAPEDSRLLASPSSPSFPNDRPVRTLSTGSFVSSPLNPTSPSPMNPFSRPLNSRPASRGSNHLSKFPSEDNTHINALFPPSTYGSLSSASAANRGSMVLYRLADDPAHHRDSALLPPKFANARDSVLSSSGDSIVSLNSDSKYPSGMPSRGLVPYAYDPAVDEQEPPDEEDFLHDPSEKGGFRGDTGAFPWRGILNVGVLVALILALLCLFVFYPVLTFYRNEARNSAIDGNIRINATGQAPVLFQMPELVDKDTPDSAKTRTGFDGEDYELVFSDEFNVEGRSFYAGDDPFWEAMDIWYGATADMEWYDPQQVTTRDGALVITMDSADTTQAGLTPGSTAPFTPADNHLLTYRSGMLQSWNKFCFSSGYIEVSVVLPGPDENTQGYWPGVWTMGNLARPGYAATTDGMWPYTYDSCDVGTFPNQTNKDGLGPAAALHSDASRDKYNFELSWLTGQRLSACTCPNSDHPGPFTSQYKGRGAPEIDVLEAEKDKLTPVGHVVSQSAQFAPFSHDYFYDNSTEDNWKVFLQPLPAGTALNGVADPGADLAGGRTRANSYVGSAVQQALSGLTRTPADMFQGSGRQFKTFGFEYWANPSNPDEGFVTWQSDGTQSVRMGAGAVGADMGPTGAQIGRRLIPEEPMSIILNLGISQNWQTIDLSSMVFPAEMLIDYVRVYQRKGQHNVGCSPKDYPTEDYINAHIQAYQDKNATVWPYEKPKNSLYDGC